MDTGCTHALLGHAASGTTEGTPLDRLCMAAGILVIAESFSSFFLQIDLLFVEQFVASFLQLGNFIFHQSSLKNISMD